MREATASTELSQDGETVLDRRLDPETGSSFLTLTPTSSRPSAALLARLKHEYSLRTKLDPSWAATPLELHTERRQQRLVLHDPGGAPLADRLGSPIATAPFLNLAIAIASAVRRMHEIGIVHRDLNPTNILVDDTAASAFLVGFGQATSQISGRGALASGGVIAGTFAYMAPEQTGRMNRSVDFRSDLYSLGVVFYQMLTGELPFTAREPVDWVYSHIARQPLSPTRRIAAIPEMLSQIVMNLLAKNAEERYQTAAGLEADLRSCREEWRSLGRLGQFPLARDDVPAQLLIPERLYGRETESQLLARALERVVRTGDPELVMVSGYSGIGKSALVHELLRETAARSVLFLTGKYDQVKRDIPFSTIGQAGGVLVRQILRGSDSEIAAWKTAMAEAVGRNGKVLVDLIPELEWLLGPQPAVLELGPTEARNRFQAVFRSFLAVCATAEHPLVLFLDDLQWIDPASLGLLEQMSTQRAARYLLLVGAYRDNEVSPTHPLMLALERLRKAKTVVQEIVLEPLAKDDFLGLVADATRSDKESAAPLATLVYEKTAGNPFFAIQFLKSLAEERHLTFDRARRSWVSDLEQVKSHGYTDNVVDLMVVKLKRLPVATLETTKRLACLGHQATVATLALVEDRHEEQITESLKAAVNAGLVTLTGDAYGFAHDRVQEAAYSLIPSEALASWHVAIGRVLLSGTAATDVDERLFEIVDHLNHGASLFVDAADRQQLSDLNLAAGKRAKTGIAYSAARAYLERARSLLADDAWAVRYEETLELHLELLECEFVVGDPQQADRLFQEVLERATSALDRAGVLHLWMRLHQGVGRLKEALGFGLTALGHLDVGFPQSKDEVLAAYLREQKAFKEQLGDRRVEDLYDLPVASDERARMVMSLLAVAGACAYNALPALTPLIYCKALNTALAWGNTPATSMTYISYGAFLVSLGDIASATAFANLGLRLNERFGDLEVRGTLLYVQGAHINPWQKHLATSLPILEQGFRSCQEVGDLVFANYNAASILTIVLEMGEELREVARVGRRYASFARESRNEPVRQWIQVGEHLALNLMGATSSTLSLDAADFSEAHSLAAVTEGRFDTGIANFHLTRMMALVFHGCFEDALAAARDCAATVNSLRTGPLEVTYHYFHGLILAALHGEADENRQRELRQALDEKAKSLEFFATHSPDSYRNRFALVAAEIARIDGRDQEAMRLYDEAIASAREHGFVQNEALACERAARYYRQGGFDRIARAYLRDARQAYETWGARAVVERLDRDHPTLVRRQGATPSQGAPTRVEHLDLRMVLKASQAVSNEIVLERLIEKLLEVSVETAGADRALLILLEDGKPGIVAEAKTARDALSVHLCQVAVSPDELPVSVLNYVTRTREPVLIDAVGTDSPFSDDPYFENHQPRSVLCLPLLKQAMLVGVQYFENHLAQGAFTEDRTALLEILASQAAISLENATLYAGLKREQTSIRELNANLERRVSERTQELDLALKKQQTILEQLAERTRDLEVARDKADQASRSKSEFLANMSHEIRTPLNAISGFTTLALRRTSEPKQARYLLKIEGAAQGLLRIIDDLLDFSKIEAGHLDMEHIPFRLSDVVESVVSQLDPLAQQKGLSLSTEVTDSVPDELVGDPLRLRQILLNLSSNAIKFTERGEVALEVVADALTEDKARLRFSVRDTGIGLSEEEANELFNAFAQADASITRRFGGTGLGLVICERLVRMMDGDIWLDSQPGIGSTFSFVVEVGRAREGDALPPLRPVAEHGEGRLKGVRLLLIEDNPINQEIGRELLEHEGATVSVAANGKLAVEAVEREGASAFDAALMDLQMPEMDGYEATRRIRGLDGGDRLPLIAMTAHAMREERERCLAAGMQDHLAKPIDPDLLTARILHWVQPGSLSHGEWGGASDQLAHPGLTGVLHGGPKPNDDLPAIDLGYGLRQCNGDESLYQRLLSQFYRQYKDAHRKLERWCEARDVVSAIALLHAIRGVAGNLGMAALAAAASALEKALSRSGFPQPQLLPAFVDRLEAVWLGLESALGALPQVPSTEGTSDREVRAIADDWRPLLRDLAVLLESADLRADRVVAKLEALAAGSEPDWLSRVSAAVAALDYEAALAALAESSALSPTERAPGTGSQSDAATDD